MRPISFEANGFPEFLRTESACEKAITRGSLKPDTPIVAYGENGERERMPAKDHPLLRKLLGIPDEEEAAQPAEAAPEPKIAESKPKGGKAEKKPAPDNKPDTTSGQAARASVPVAGQQTAPTAAVSASTSEPLDQDEAESGTPDRPNNGLASKLALGFIAVISLLFFISQCSSEPTDGFEDAAYEEDAAASDAAVDTAVADAVEQSLYAVREIAVRAGPSAESARVTLLPRGTYFTGIAVPSTVNPQYYWLQISSGAYSGNYVSMTNLSGDERPSLDTSVAGLWYISDSYTARAAPRDDAPELTEAEWRLSPGTQLDVAGVTGAGILASGWAEVMLPKNAGVGYVPMDMLYQADNQTSQTTSGRRLALQNSCRNNIFLVVRAQTSDGWRDLAVEIPARSTRYAGLNGQDVGLTSNEVYFVSLAPGTRRDFSTELVRLSDYGLRGSDLKQMNIGIDSSGAFQSNFSC